MAAGVNRGYVRGVIERQPLIDVQQGIQAPYFKSFQVPLSQVVQRMLSCIAANIAGGHKHECLCFLRVTF